MRSCYVSGPMSDREDHGYPLFEDAALDLRGEGWLVLSPREGAPTLEQVERAAKAAGGDFRRSHMYAQLMRRDFHYLLFVDAVFVLSGWESSEGARKEVLLATTIGLPIIEYATRRAIVPQIALRVQPDDGADVIPIRSS